jgi:hypothetical protein
MPEPIGPIFPTQVPSYSEAADIRKAFNLYHYGTETVPTLETQVLRNSVAGEMRYINQRLAEIEAGASEIIQLTQDQSLNDITVSGIYHSPESVPSDKNYPVATAGILITYRHVVGLNTFVYQSYQTSGVSNNLYWRVGNLAGATPTWQDWALASKNGHTHPENVTNTTFNSRIASSFTSSRAAIIDSSGRIASSPNITDQELNQLDGISTANTIQTQLDDKAALNHLHDDRYHRLSVQPRVFVQSSTPTGANVGDLWFW